MQTLPVGLQLYSIRDVLENASVNFKAVLQQLHAFGYSGVEFAGTYGLSPEFIRDTLAEVGLVPLGAHVPLDEMMKDAQKVARDYATIGCQYVVVPYLPEEYRPLAPGYATVLTEIKRIGQIMRDHGMTLLYHNHDFEFVLLPDGTYGLDDIYKQIPATLLMAELDTCWIKVAGENPAAYVSKYAGRCPIIHLKDFIKEGAPKRLYKLIGIADREPEEKTGLFEFRAVGFGQQIWRPILEASANAGSSWVVVEQDEHYDVPSMECVRVSREYLKIFGW